MGKKSRLLAASAVVTVTILSSQAASAQQATSAPQASDATPGDIIVTGTRDPRATAANSVSPISIVGSEQLQKTGAPDLMDKLVDISPSIERVYLAPSYASGVDKITMRGLSSDNTLILLNGIRRHTTATIEGVGPEVGNAPSDLGMFPSSAVGRIEVLTDGASAQYGADAIAGVVNIILKNNDHGAEFSTNNGVYAAGDGFTSDTTGNVGMKLGSKGFLSLSGEYLHADHTVRSNPDERGPGTLVNKFFGNPLQNKETVSYNAGIDLTDNLQLYSFGSYAHRVSTQFQYWRPPTSLPQVYPNGYEPQTAEKENDYAGTVGLKGTAGGWDYDLSGTYGYDHTNFITSDTANLALYAATGSTPTKVYTGHMVVRRLPRT